MKFNFIEFNNGYFKIKHAVEFSKENPDEIVVKSHPQKDSEAKKSWPKFT